MLTLKIAPRRLAGEVSLVTDPAIVAMEDEVKTERHGRNKKLHGNIKR